MKKKVFVVPHSHWDREWYFTIEDSNILLAENMPYLMDVLEKDERFNAYTFDAQASILDEFVKVCPEEKTRLSKLIKDKRIFVGPWYTQTDSLLVNKESVVRNLLYGTTICEDYGHSMNVGYLPDIFGQNAYLPTIFKGFDIDYAIFQRGLYNDELNNDLNMGWTSPDGEEIPTNNIFLGYGPGKFLASDDEYINEKLIPMLDRLADLNKSTDNLLLPAGGDQVLVRDHFPNVIEELNKKVDKYEFILTDYETFMKETFSNNTFENKIEGELRGTQKSRIHRTIGSVRYDIKKLNSEVENKILNVLEPLAVMGKKFGIKYPQSWLDMMWKLLFDVHAHDSIGGCNSDDTNKEVVNRLEKVTRMTDSLINIIKKKITYAISEKLGKENILTLFNTNTRESKGYFEAVIFTNKPGVKLTTTSGEEVKFEIAEQELLSGGKQVMVTAEGEKEVELPGYYRSKLYINKEVASFGWETILVEETEGTSKVEASRENFISNDYMTVSVEGGYVNLEKGGVKTEDFFYFENTGDYGDSYDYSPLAGDKAIFMHDANFISSEKGEMSEKMTLSHKVVLPKNLDERKNLNSTEEFEIFTTIELRRDEKLIRISHKLDNNVEDHRLRVVFKTGITGQTHSYSDTGYSLIAHEINNPYFKNWRENKFVEAPIEIYNMENVALLRNENKTAGVIVEGIKEYQIINEGEMAVSLFKGIGLLGRDNLVWRPGRASGINNKVVYTPNAQLTGELEFNYAFYIDENVNDTEIFNQVERFIVKKASYQKQSLNTFEERVERFEIPMLTETLEANASFLNIKNENVFVSCIKASHDGERTIVRLYNPTATDEKVVFGEEVIISNLKERELDRVKEVTVKAKGFTTIKL